MPKLSIEIPTNSKQRFEQYVLSSLPYYKSLANLITFNINFQKEFTNADVEHYAAIFSSYGLEMNYIVSTYETPAYLVKIREDTHQINPHTPYSISMDDDINVLSGRYADVLHSAIQCLDEHPHIGCINICVCKNKKRFPTELIFRPIPCVRDIATRGGIIVRNISSTLFSTECVSLFGGHQDSLLVFDHVWSGYDAYYVHCVDYQHYEHRRTYKDSGSYKYNWHDRDNEEGSVAHYLDTHWHKYSTPTAVYDYSGGNSDV